MKASSNSDTSQREAACLAKNSALQCDSSSAPAQCSDEPVVQVTHWVVREKFRGRPFLLQKDASILACTYTHDCTAQGAT